MIVSNLLKRIFSSSILFFFLLILIYVKKIYLLIVIIVLTILILYELYKLLDKLLSKFIWTLFIIFSTYTVYEIAFYGNHKEIFIFLLLISVSTDVGGFVVGKIFGGYKLTKISPNKTYSGAFGGIFFTIIICYFFLLGNNIINITANHYLLTQLYMIILLSLISQVGDLCISFLKRKSNVKDTGNIIPGHGGVLDRLDGVIFVFPFYFMINLLMNNI